MDFDISRKSGELLVSLPDDAPDAVSSSGNQSDSSDQFRASQKHVNHHQPLRPQPVEQKDSTHHSDQSLVVDDREPPAYANTRCKPPVTSPKPRPLDQMVITSDWVQVESVLLMNDGKGLGFGIVGGKSTGVIVKTLVCGGIADRVSSHSFM